MSRPTNAEVFERILGELKAEPPEGLMDVGVMSVGILLGGGFPGPAAAVALLLEQRFPSVKEWRWSRESPEQP